MQYKFVYKVSQKNDQCWSGVSGVNSKSISDDILPPYEIYSVMKLYSEANINLEVLGKLLFNELESSFQNNSDKYEDFISRLEDSLWKLRAKLEDFISRDSELMEKGIDMEMGVVVVSLGVLYASIVGESKIFLYRNDKFVDISKGLIDINMMGFAKTGSLKLNEQDRIVILTGPALIQNDIEIFINFASELNLDILKQIKDEPGAAMIMIGSENLNWVDFSSLSNQGDTLKLEEVNLTEELSNKSAYNDTEIKHVLTNEDDTKDHSNLKFGDDKYYSELNDDRDVEYTSNFDNSFKKIEEKNSTEKKSIFKNQLSKIKSTISKFSENKKTYAYLIRRLSNIFIFIVQRFFKFLNEEFGLSFRKHSSKTNININLQRGKHSKYVDFRKRNRRFLYAGIALLFVYLFFSFQNADYNRRIQEKHDTFQNQITELKQLFIQFEKDSFSINMNSPEFRSELVKKIDSASKRCRDIISQITQDVDYVKAQMGVSSLSSLNSINSDFLKLRNRALKLEEINSSNVRLISDVSRQFSGANLTSLAFTIANGQRLVYVTDEKNNNVYKISVDKVGNISKILLDGNDSFKNPRLAVTASNGDIIIYDNNESASISRIFVNNNDKVQRFNVPVRDTIGVVAADIFTNGSIYELRPSPNSYIHRRLPSGNGFATGGANYVATNPPNWRTDLDFTSAIDISVPYEVYVLIKGQGIKRYLSGGDNSITLQSFINLLSEDLEYIKQASSIDVSQKYLAIADSLNKRIILFTVSEDSRKDLVFNKQFKYVGQENIFSNIKDIFINELNDGGEIYVLDDNRIILVNF